MNSHVIGERYRLERELGHGAMGEIWLATDLELERPVALKLLAPDADRKRFEREARAAAALAHPNVTRVYDYGELQGRPYMALEYLGGGSLEDRLHTNERLDDAETRSIATEIAAGLAHAHEHGLVHRDLKPANILFDDEGHAKIADFGIARTPADSTLTDAGTVLGTAAYISPEQAEGRSATPASDVYSFGVVLYRMLTGRLPFEAERPLELVDMHRRLEAPPVETVRPDAPPELAAVTGDALAKDPRERPADGAALAAGLGIHEVPAAAIAETTLVLPTRSRRTRLALAAAALGLLAAAGTAGALLLGRDHSNGRTPAIPARAHRVPSQTAATQTTTPPSTASSTSSPTTTTPATTSAPPVGTATLPATVPTVTATTPLTTTTATSTSTATASAG